MAVVVAVVLGVGGYGGGWWIQMAMRWGALGFVNAVTRIDSVIESQCPRYPWRQVTAAGSSTTHTGSHAQPTSGCRGVEEGWRALPLARRARDKMWGAGRC